MRIYIIGNDGITLCREPPAAVNEGEIVVASNEELHAALARGRLRAAKGARQRDCAIGDDDRAGEAVGCRKHRADKTRRPAPTRLSASHPHLIESMLITGLPRPRTSRSL
jgi:hypothetical protein